MRRGRKGGAKMEFGKYTDFRPIFVEDDILRARQLECVRDFPREMEGLRYADYADGILFGCRVSAGATAVAISQGVILRNGVFYRLTAPAAVPYRPSEELQYLKLSFDHDGAAEKNIPEKTADIVLETSPPAEKETELARFNLKEGARLRSDYTGFDDLDTEFDTLCVLHSPCAAPGGTTLLPFVTALFAEEALSRNPENLVDVQFAMFCLQSERVNPAVLKHYLGAGDTDLFGLYKGLSKKLAAIKRGAITDVKTTRTLRKILVD
jgi:hypothetical protein